MNPIASAFLIFSAAVTVFALVLTAIVIYEVLKGKK